MSGDSPREIDSPEDVLRVAIAQLEAAGKPLSPGIEFDLSPVHAGIDPGKEYQHRSELIDACGHRGHGWVKPARGSGGMWILTATGAEEASKIKARDRVEALIPSVGKLGRLNEALRHIWQRIDVIVKLVLWLITVLGAYWLGTR